MKINFINIYKYKVCCAELKDLPEFSDHSTFPFSNIESASLAYGPSMQLGVTHWIPFLARLTES